MKKFILFTSIIFSCFLIFNEATAKSGYEWASNVGQSGKDIYGRNKQEKASKGKISQKKENKKCVDYLKYLKENISNSATNKYVLALELYRFEDCSSSALKDLFTTN